MYIGKKEIREIIQKVTDAVITNKAVGIIMPANLKELNNMNILYNHVFNDEWERGLARLNIDNVIPYSTRYPELIAETIPGTSTDVYFSLIDPKNPKKKEAVKKLSERVKDITVKCRTNEYPIVTKAIDAFRRNADEYIMNGRGLSAEKVKTVVTVKIPALIADDIKENKFISPNHDITISPTLIEKFEPGLIEHVADVANSYDGYAEANHVVTNDYVHKVLKKYLGNMDRIGNMMPVMNSYYSHKNILDLMFVYIALLALETPRDRVVSKTTLSNFVNSVRMAKNALLKVFSILQNKIDKSDNSNAAFYYSDNEFICITAKKLEEFKDLRIDSIIATDAESETIVTTEMLLTNHGYYTKLYNNHKVMRSVSREKNINVIYRECLFDSIKESFEITKHDEISKLVKYCKNIDSINDRNYVKYIFKWSSRYKNKDTNVGEFIWSIYRFTAMDSPTSLNFGIAMAIYCEVLGMITGEIILNGSEY